MEVSGEWTIYPSPRPNPNSNLDSIHYPREGGVGNCPEIPTDGNTAWVQYSMLQQLIYLVISTLMNILDIKLCGRFKQHIEDKLL